MDRISINQCGNTRWVIIINSDDKKIFRILANLKLSRVNRVLFTRLYTIISTSPI